MIIINGINSEIAKKILSKFLKKNKVIGIYNSFYSGPKSKNLILFKKNKINYKKIERLSKKNKKISFINFAATRDENLLINIKKKNLNKIFESNLIEPINLLKKIIPHMIKNKFGRIIFLSSSTAENGYPGNIGYSATKSSLKGVVGTISKEYKNFNITSNIISLGYFETKMWKSLSDKKRSDLLKSTLSQKICNPLALYELIKLVIKYKEINLSKIYLDGGNLLR
jgi:short-subunit dehydrogenase